MTKLEHCKPLDRDLRRGEPEELGVRTEELLLAALDQGNDQDAIDLAGYLLDETAMMVEYQPELLNALWTWVATNLSEEQLQQMIRRIAELDAWQVEHMAQKHKTGRTMSVIEYARLHEAEHKRAMRTGFTITEEPDRFKMVFTNCRMARLRRARDADGNQPACLGKTQEPHAWSWGRAGVAYWCTRACTAEQLSIEKRGYPWMVTECALKDEDPCIRYLYKNPEDIPEKYYEQLGYQRDPSRFQRP
jgi:hypothetical protein